MFLNLRQYAEYFELCSGDLFGSKFLIPCDPAHYLSNVYPDWEKPVAKGYKWLNVDFVNKREWTDGDPITYYPKNDDKVGDIIEANLKY